MYYVYVLKCADHTLYTGVTTDLGRRVNEHNNSEIGAKYTRGRRPAELVFSKQFNDRSTATKAELFIKKLPRKQKLDLINGADLDIIKKTSVSIDINAYFERIGYMGDYDATLETLRQIHQKQPEAIAFENLSPFLGEAVKLDAVSLMDKMIANKRGGYCLEHNLLFKHVLDELGFEVTGLSARVTWNQSPGSVPPRTHMLLLVNIKGADYIADVGFGGITLTAPLLLEPNIVQNTPHEPFRLILADGLYTLEVKLGKSWKALYYFNLEEQLLTDYETANKYLCDNPKSRWVTDLIAARSESGRRHSLLNNVYSVYDLHGAKEIQTLTNVVDLKQTLETAFLIQLPDVPHLSRKLKKLLSRSSQ